MNHRLDVWEMGAAIVGVIVGVVAGAWFWGTDSREPTSGDPFGR